MLRGQVEMWEAITAALASLGPRGLALQEEAAARGA